MIKQVNFTCSLWIKKITKTMLPMLKFHTNYGFNELFHNCNVMSIPVNPPPFRGSLPRKRLISRMDWVSCAGDINLPHTSFPPARYPPNKKIKYNKILTYILRSIFLEIPHLELPRWWKTARDTNVNDIRLLICLTPLQVNWVMEIN